MRALIGKICSLGFAVAFLGAVSALCFLGEHLSLGDRVSHFPLYWALLALGIIVRALLMKRWILSAVGGLLFLIHAVPVASLWLSDGRVPAGSERAAELTVVSANLYANNLRKPEARAKLLELSPDLLVLMEVNSEWQTVLKPLFEQFPHTIRTRETTWLLSRHPFRLAQCTEMRVAGSSESNALLEATVIVSGSAIRVVAIHVPTPRGSARVAQQRSQAADYVMALQRDKDAPHQMLIGDFNTSPFSAVFRHIVHSSGLRDASKGRGYHPTWGPRLPKEPILPWLGIPIDHALVSDQILVEDRRVGEMPGSDHRYQQMKLRF